MSTLPPGLKPQQQKTWATGDFSKVGVHSIIAGELLCEAVRLHAGERVLDVATGSGNTALSAARRGAIVDALDFVPALLERGRERAHAEGLHKITFGEGDTEALPFPDHSFDVVLSTFGHMFAPDPAKTTAEMARVCRPGGRVGFAAWTAQGFIGQMFRTGGKYNPPPPGLAPPAAWGDEAIVRERFAPYATSFQFERQSVIIRGVTPEEWLEHMRHYFGPMNVMWNKLDEAGRASFTQEMLAQIAAANQSGDTTVLIPAEYLETVAVLR